MNIIFIVLVALVVTTISGQTIRYEAEKGHLLGTTSSETILGGYSYSGYVNYHEDQTTNDRVIFTVNAPADGDYPLYIRFSSIAESVLSIHANGFELLHTKLPSSASWATKSENLSLRQGVNTVILQMEKMSKNTVLSLDYIEITGAVDVAARGATLPYVGYEAEDASTNGQIIGPGRQYYTIQAEASARKAVQISGSQYVEFTLTAPANAFVLRFNIPDSSNGDGLTAEVNVYVNGQYVFNVTVTSKFSYQYGQYPYTRNPSDGDPHHYFDEVRSLFQSTLSAGTKVRFVGTTGGIVYTIDLADFYTVPSPYTIPGNFLSITSYGADPSGLKDSTSQIRDCINDAQNQGKGVWIPIGNFAVSSTFTVNKVTIRGAGPWYSTLFATVLYGIGFYGYSGPSINVEFYDFAIYGDTNIRNDNQADGGFGGAFGTNCIIQNIWIEHVKCGMWLAGPFNGLHITGVTIHNTFADGININIGAQNTVVEQSMLRNTGDDGLAMWSINQADVGNTFQFNTIEVPVLANGIAIYGGSGNSATDNYVSDTICEGSGLQASNRFTSVPMAGTTTFARNTVVRTGSPNHTNSSHSGGLWFWAGDEAMTGTVTVNNIDIQDSSYTGITFWGSNIINLSFDTISINKTETYAIEVEGPSGSVSFSNTVATGLGSGGIYSCDSAFVINQGSGNSGWSDKHC